MREGVGVMIAAAISAKTVKSPAARKRAVQGLLKAMHIQRKATEKPANIREETSPRPFSARRTNSGLKRSAATNRKNARSPENQPGPCFSA